MNKNINLARAKNLKNDEFYTCYDDIECEINLYQHHFSNKIIYCNCDDPTKSKFSKFFKKNFLNLKLKKLIITSFRANNKGSVQVITKLHNRLYK